MEDQDLQFAAAYGEAMFYAHLIDDLVALHIYECGWFHVNGYAELSREKILKLTSKQRINELLSIYHKQQSGAVERLVSALHLVRKIRNELTHAFVVQVGSDLEGEEGRDQVIAMLKNVVFWQRVCLKPLRKMHETVLKRGITEAVERALERDDPPFDARVARSKIQRYLDQLESRLKK